MSSYYEHKEKAIKSIAETFVAALSYNTEDKINELATIIKLIRDNEIMDTDKYGEIIDEVIRTASEIIYNGVAMEFLSTYDTSLRISLSIASELGYDAKDLNSEILASLLLEDMLRDDIDDILNEVANILEQHLDNLTYNKGV